MDRLILPGLALSLVLVSASAFAQVKPEGAPVRLGELRFEKDLKDPRGYLTVERSSVGRRVKPVEETVTYVKGHTGFAARSSHNNEDDHGGDLSIRVGPRTGPWTKRNELYIHFRVKYEKEYRNVPGARTWNVKWLWTLGKVAHNEVAFYNYSYDKGRLTAIWQLNGGGTGWDGGTRVSKWGTIPYAFGDWLEVKIYFRLSSGANHSNPDGVQWLKLNGVKVIEGRNVVTGRPGRMTSPSIKSGDGTPLTVNAARHHGECPRGHGWWQIDDYEVWDGLPRRARLIIKDDFEDGFDPGWDATNSYVITADEKHGGKHSAAGNTAKHNGAWDAPLLYYAKLPKHETLFVRFRLKFPKDYTWPKTANFMRFSQHAPGVPKKEIEWWHMGEKGAAIHVYGDEPVKRPSYGPIPMRDGKWHEYAVYVDYRRRVLRAWFDSVGDYTDSSALFTVNTPFPDVRHYTHIRLPYYAKTRSPGNGVFWIDDVEVWDGLPQPKHRKARGEPPA